MIRGTWTGCFSALIMMGAMATPLAAQTPTEAPPALDAAGRPEPIPVTAFAEGFQLEDARLSATGKRLAFGQIVDGRSMVRIYDADTLALERVIDAGDADDFNGFRWPETSGCCCR